MIGAWLSRQVCRHRCRSQISRSEVIPFALPSVWLAPLLRSRGRAFRLTPSPAPPSRRYLGFGSALSDSVSVARAAATASVAEAVAVSVFVAAAETAAVALSVALIVALELGVVVVTVADTSASAGGVAVTVTPLVDVTRGVTVFSTPRAVGEIVVVTIAVLVAVVSV